MLINEPCAASRRDEKVLQLATTVCFAIVMLYACLFPFLRPYGEAPLLSVFAASLFCFIFLPKLRILLFFYLFVTYACVILFLSILELMPDAWTRYFNRGAAFRQFFWIIAVPPLFSVCAYGLKRNYSFVVRNAVILTIIAFIFSRLARWYSAKDLLTEELILIYTFTNDNMIIILLIFIVFFTRNVNIPSSCVAFVLLFLFVSSSQSQLVVLVASIIFFFGYGRLISIVYTAFLIGFLSVAPFFAQELYLLDSNSGVRAVLWYDALRAVAESFGIGVGFGTESITNIFHSIKPYEWHLTGEYDSDRLHVSAHSTPYNVLIRLGVPGFLVFSVWVFNVVKFRNLSCEKENRLKWCVYIVFITSSSINIGFFSVNFLFGSIFCLVFIHYLNKSDSQGGGGGLQHVRNWCNTSLKGGLEA